MVKQYEMIPSGLLLLHKQLGVTSFDSLRDIKRALGTGKAGHTGTLDKFAEGLLLVLTGRALKLSQWFTHLDKQYEGLIRFGDETDTLDPEGDIIASAPVPSREAVEAALTQFRGDIEQAPPAYSAIHIDGERASALARRGEAPVMRKRPVTIYRLELLSWEPPLARIFVHCSSGTYIRSLARDIALAVGSRAHLVALLRTQVANFKLEDAGIMRIGDRGSGIGESLRVHPIDRGVFNTIGMACFDISPVDAKKIVQGKPLGAIAKDLSPGRIEPAVRGAKDAKEEKEEKEENTVALFCEDELIAVIERHNNEWKYGYVYAHN